MTITQRIYRRVLAHRRGWIATPKDFLDLGGRAAIDQALRRLVASGKLRRVGRGLYDIPRVNQLLGRPTPADVDALASALARRTGHRVMQDAMVAANRLGLTTAVPAQILFATDGPTRKVRVGGRQVVLRHAPGQVFNVKDPQAAAAVQALLWLGARHADSPSVVQALQQRLSPSAKRGLLKHVKALPGWASPVIRAVTA